MRFTLAEIAGALGTEALGDGAIVIRGLAEPADAGPDDLALAMDEKYGPDLARGAARAALLWDGADWRGMGLSGAVCVARGKAAMPILTRMMDPGPGIAPGIHPSAVIDAGARIGDGAAIGPFVVIGAGVEIGPRARIGAHVSIGDGTRTGADLLLHAGVRIGARVVIGDRFIAQPNATIGGDGFSFVTPEKESSVETLRAGVGAGGAEGVAGSAHWSRVHSLGGVVIGDDVELGANSSIDQGTIRPTVIGRGTKIDNQVQIGHNCIIGEDCLFCGNVGIAGSVRTGDRVVLAGKVGVSDNLFIGDDVIAGGATNIFVNVPAGRAIWGWSATKMEQQVALQRELRRLPRLADRLRALEKAVPKDGKTD